MKQRIFIFFSIFLYFVLLSFIGKIIFMLVNGDGITGNNIFDVLYHGLPLDMSMSGYLTAIPALILLVSIWIKPKVIANIYNVYFILILSVISIITVADIVVYPYWGFHFDSSVFLYLQKPKEAMASASVLEIILGAVAMIVFALITYIGYVFIIRKQVLNLTVPKFIGKTFGVLLLLTGALFLPIRGGISVSTMNVGRVYFSDNMFLNHAAINPQFNLMYSFFKSDNFASQYQFYSKEEANEIFAELNKQPVCDSMPQLLNTDRPNVILFILESFSADVALDSLVAPNMSCYAKEGVLFNNFYANSYRTDRGIVSIMSAYPGHPTAAIMKYPQKTESLPTITKTLKQTGYENLSLYYGGDADFANMRSYFVGACGIKEIVSDKDFPLSERMTKWGVPDKFVLDRAYSEIATKQQATPFFKTILTLSSHEPFDVPVNKFKVPFLNAVSYTDDCIGSFVERVRATDLWQNTLIIFIADHAMQSYPEGVNNNDPKRFHIPMIWLGGAVEEPRVVSDYGSQNDMAATLFSQMKVAHSDFKFSKDMLNMGGHKFSFYSYVNGFCMTDSTGTVTYDNDQRKVIHQSGNPDLEKRAKAFFQEMYLDLGNR